MKPIIIDTDPGIDDAIAIAIAAFSRELDIKLITTVNGNVTIDKVTKNVLRLLAFLKKDIPVASGAKRPLLSDYINASDVHGESGMDGFEFPEENTDLLLKETAVNAMYKTIMKSNEKITLVPIGPLTNIAILFRTYPEVMEKIEEIVLMGGAVGRGNAGIYSEFNIKCDPEAARIVFESGLTTTMCTLDVGLKVPIYKEEIERIRELNDVGKMFYGLFNRYRSGSFEEGLRMFDSCAIAYLLKPDIFIMKDACVKVETKGEFTYGATCIDFNGFFKEKPNANVTYDIDVSKFKEWFFNSIDSCNF
ncbi:ribonucleoside hydrolase RihC [Lagierella sp.]|uniref:ribonucleoside hydrolase RihC n=1 Tax=Lagierella sp. TaxID=2849657 RepID=UPI0026082630|nr:ribonucleoside hydrolase RihC [Lagierella sp.]